MADVTRASAAKRVSSGDGALSLEPPAEAAEEDFLPLSPSEPSGVTVDDVLSLLPPPLPLLPALAAALRLGLVLVGLDLADEAPPASLPDPPDAPASALFRGVTCRAGVDAAARRADAASSCCVCCSCPAPDDVVAVAVVTVDVAGGGADAGGTP